MRIRYRIGSFAVAISLLYTPCVKAFLPAPETRTIPSANGKYLLVLITPEEERESRSQKSISEQERIERLYPQSGLYRNDGTTEILWPFEYLSTAKDIYVCDDGIHLVVSFLDWDRFASDRGNALDFYANGHLVSSFNEDELLVGYWSRLAASNLGCASWPTVTAARLDEQSHIFEFETNWGDAFYFNFVTGKLVDSRLPWIAKVMLLGVVTLLGLVGWWLWLRILKQRRGAELTI